MYTYTMQKLNSRQKKNLKRFLIALVLIVLGGIIYYFFTSPKMLPNLQVHAPNVSPTITPFTIYKKPVLKPSDRYDIFLIGDSMMHAFGPRGGHFNETLSQTYPDKFFEIVNYAEANQSILLLPDRLNQEVQADHDLLLQPILKGNPELIIIESFGYNPLSQLGITEGLKKQNEILTQVMTTLTNKFPNTSIMFMATIAPDKKTYAQKITHASADDRWAQAEERIEYITNHIKYAKEHNIPLIDAYTESLDADGNGNLKYINPDDNIHPSEEGLAFMGRIMTKRIGEEKIFPE